MKKRMTFLAKNGEIIKFVVPYRPSLDVSLVMDMELFILRFAVLALRE